MQASAMPMERRHDLDALRAFAMLLGIALHAALSFAPIPWIVQDSRQHGAFSLFYTAIHGFRMPLFFLVSGFFTALLWRRRGAIGLLRQRALRILVPCLLGLVTVIPAMNLISGWAMRTAQTGPVELDDGSLVAAIRGGDSTLVRERLKGGANVNAPDPKVQVMPLAWATMAGDAEIVRILVDAGANLNGRNGDGSTALHGAAFLGRTAAAEALLAKGADALARNNGGELPLASSRAPAGVTRYIATLLGIPLGEEAEIERGRAEVRRLIGHYAPESLAVSESEAKSQQAAAGGGMLETYRRLVTSDRLNVSLGGVPFHLVLTPVFNHLWFLWFLCWLLPVFVAVAWVLDRYEWARLPRWMVLSPARFLWLIPLTLVPQWFMGLGGPAFGPDTSVGLLPQPHVLLYYGVFFGFGALYFASDDSESRLGRWWWLLLPAGLLLAFPAALATMGNRPLTAVAQVLYVWAMSCGLLGLFRTVLKREWTAIRYLSDASYWLYLVHLPLIIGAQAIVRYWPVPPLLKFTLVCGVVTLFLLAVYELLVRPTWLGALLNGPRPRQGRPGTASQAPSITGPSLHSQPET